MTSGDFIRQTRERCYELMMNHLSFNDCSCTWIIELCENQAISYLLAYFTRPLRNVGIGDLLK